MLPEQGSATFALENINLMNNSYLHLKICEGCGRLWARNQAVTGVYCRPCAARFEDFPAPRSRRQLGRPHKANHSGGMQVHQGGVR